MFGRLFIVMGALGLCGCVERASSVEALESASAPISVASTARELSDGRLEWRVVVGPGADRGWLERAGAHLIVEAGGRRVQLTRLGAGLEGRWLGAPGERATLSWRASDGSAGLFVEAGPGAPEVASPRFVSVPATGMVRAAVPLGGRP